MIIPQIQGYFTQTDFFIFTAADTAYFDAHGIPLINSIIANTNYGVHIHIYDPRPDQLEFCNSKSPRVSATYEYINPIEFDIITNYWVSRTEFKNARQQQMYDKGIRYGRQFLKELITRTYYACTRFIRLNQLLTTPIRCLSIDVDGIVRKNFTNILLHDEKIDFFLYEKRNNEHLAGAILFNNNSKPFLENYARVIEKCIHRNDVYWFMDQIVLDQIVPKYKKGLLPVSYIDWEMDDNSAIWTAKGKRKELDLFKDEQTKYKS
jgi:hypothetical protein